MSGFHTPALLKEAIIGLNIRPNGKYIDATIGGGGHAAEIILRGGKVLGIDQDQAAIEHVQANSQKLIANGQLTLVLGNFADINKIARESGFMNADGILFDLGVSSYQIEKSGKGFSFLRDEPLDMRMGRPFDSFDGTQDKSAQGKSAGVDLTAKIIVNKSSEDELYNIFSKFGEEKNARTISGNIVRERKIKPIETSRELADIVARSIATKKSRKGRSLAYARDRHPATKVFQALRIVVNSEIDNLKRGLDGAFLVLAPDARLAVISFHSLEDRVVKLFFVKLAREGAATLINKKPIIASEEEINANRRARSAKLRILEKISVA